MNIKENEHQSKSINQSQGKLQELYEILYIFMKTKENIWQSVKIREDHRASLEVRENLGKSMKNNSAQ